MPKKLFEKGNKLAVGNKGNKSPLKEHWQMNQEHFVESAGRVLKMTIGELKEYSKDPNCPALDAMIIGQMQAAMHGKTMPFEFLMVRLVGPIKRTINVKAEVSLAKDVYRMTDDEIEAEYKEIIQDLTLNDNNT